VLKSAWFKGVTGEFIVNLAARLFLNKNDYQLMNNVTIPAGDGSPLNFRHGPGLTRIAMRPTMQSTEA